ncbi:hypothetical protein GLOTRDRAFT_117242 [Gloeophyllum trabeum ATCC 11539]|uniref:DUF92-domain-containing protein n=1 Tax=Gloeophyllum trabeum (strain ATCC 11539 / FP-39264 / Madison 617) TaxID=670483 RepID=S7RG30_GLOTA|nr:uncharacterized protein GLOTRDRAFT_117242 [Gloeophyllum trabeum ATCC 11539]EPQ53185.1 hypothetical protein GLOTRDRAFT_117242 [Gloeophyllum trabeum ATCC 11539]
MPSFPLIPLSIAALFSAQGLRRGSLSPSGAVTATLIGTLTLAVPLRAFGVSLLSFYLIGSRATKIGKQLKAQLEEGHTEGGQRTGFQVLCNSFSAFGAALLWEGLFVPGSLPALVINWLGGTQAPTYLSNEWCPVSTSVLDGWSRALVFAALGHFACCLGDTLASELGILSKTPPILITTLKPVPPGTNGGISGVGTLASLAGGIAMGATLAACLAIENSVCRADAWAVSAQAVAWGGFAGLFGSLIDSLLGATVQMTKYSATSKRILTDESAPPKDAEIKVVSGLNILTNNQVNLLSSVVTAVVVARFA